MQAYDCPVYFQDDWLNTYFDLLSKGGATSKPNPEDGIIESDYRFVYMGKKVCLTLFSVQEETMS